MIAPGTRTGEIWILGATGRIGRAAVALLAARGEDIVLVGRSAERLREVATGAGCPDAKIIVADAVPQLAAEISRGRPAVVVNLLGAYEQTAGPLARACLPGGHYVDLAADLAAVSGTLARHDEAAAAGSTLVTGAGFGVLATEAVVVELCAGRSTPDLVRVDALSSVATEAGVMGEAFASIILAVITAGGRRYRNGRLVTTPLGADATTHTLPDGQTIRSGSAPTAELIAAQRASQAPNVIVTSGLAPTSAVVRLLIPALAALLSVPAIRRFAIRRMGRTVREAAPRPRTHSWGHAVVTWPDGSRREGWLRAGDGMDYTADVVTETAVRLARGEAPAGAYTPAAALGPGLATAAGATFLLDQPEATQAAG